MSWDASGQMMRAAYAGLLEAARQAAANEPLAVRAFIQRVFTASEFLAHPPPGVKDRLVRAELAFRGGSSRGVAEPDIVTAVNEAVVRLTLPDYFRTSSGQLRIFRESRAPLIHDFAGGGSEDSRSEWMSPAEALFLVTDLARQKYFVPENRISPEAWEARARQRLAEAAEALPQAGARRGAAPSANWQVSVWSVPPLPLAGFDVANDEGAGAQEVHRVLDAMGVPR